MTFCGINSLITGTRQKTSHNIPVFLYLCSSIRAVEKMNVYTYYLEISKTCRREGFIKS